MRMLAPELLRAERCSTWCPSFPACKMGTHHPRGRARVSCAARARLLRCHRGQGSRRGGWGGLGLWEHRGWAPRPGATQAGPGAGRPRAQRETRCEGRSEAPDLQGVTSWGSEGRPEGAAQ